MHQLTQCLDILQTGGLAYGGSFPSKPTDVSLVAEKFVKHAEGRKSGMVFLKVVIVYGFL